ncbi:MAG TPA: GIDE domain-containing protein [Myxococcaceae bacterium]|jgi:hypothetical protein
MTVVPAFLVVGGVALLGAFAMYRWGRSFRAIARRIEEMTSTPASRVAPGFVEVKGRAKGARSPVTSPVSKRPCVYYRFLVEELVKRGKSSTWRTRIDDQQECGLLVVDAWQGEIEVNLRAATLMLKPDLRTKSGFLNDAPPELEATLRQYGGTSQGFIFNKAMRYTETVLNAGDEVYVIGTARQQGGRMMIDRGGDLFIVSDQPEEEVTRSFHGKKTSRYLVSVLLALVGLGFLVLSAAAPAWM